MKKGSFREFLIAEFGQSEEMPLDRVRQAVFSYYSTAQLLRAGSYDKRRLRSKRYTSGELLTEQERAALLESGIKAAIRAISQPRRKLISIDREKRIAKRI